MSFTFKGCKIKVSFYFFASVAIMALFDSSGMLIGGMLSATLHELGHLAAMLLIPDRQPSQISVTPFGLRIKGSPLAEFADGEIIVLSAGCAVNLVLAAATFGIFPKFAAMNLVLGALNALPVDSFDGGAIFKILLSRRFGAKATEVISTAVSLLVVIIMAFVGVRILFCTGYNFTLLGMSLWLLATIVLRLARGH